MIRNILFLNAGRRCELIRAFRETLNARGGGKIVASDIVTHAPALHVADTFYILPPRNNPNAIPELIDLCRKEQIQLIIPTIDPDLIFLDTIRTQLRNELPDLHILLPPSHVVQIAANKIRTRAFFQEAGHPPPPAVDIHQPEITFPIFVKPVAGSASQGILKIDNRRQLQLWLTTYNPQEYIIERYIPGDEYTVDLISDQQASPLAAVCRRRLRVRGGEVVHARIEDLPELRDIAFELATKLQSTGPITLQFRRPDPNTFIPIEINARMGGGLPLTIASGYNWPAMILQTLENPRQRLTPPAPRHPTMTMSRYDQSIFTSDTAPDIPRLMVRPSRKIPAVKAVIVDLDDTLYPEVEYVFSGFRHAAELVVDAYAISIEPVLRQLFNEGVRHNIFLRAMQKLGLPADELLIKKMVTAYRHAPSPLQPYSDFPLLCEFARRHQLTMAIHTDGIPSVQHMKIRRLGICYAFRHILCTDDLGGPAFRKPHPNSYHALLHNMGVSPEETLLIADNPLKDFVTPRALGIRCVRIRRPDGLYSSQEPTTTEFLPHAEITGFHQLNELSDLTFLSS